MARERLYTEDEVRQAMIVGVGLGGQRAVPAGTNDNIERAMGVFRGGHGRDVPNYTTFKELHERREWKALAETHLACAHMSATEALPHAAAGLLALGLELVDELA
jgi:hypothetical protein